VRASSSPKTSADRFAAGALWEGRGQIKLERRRVVRTNLRCDENGRHPDDRVTEIFPMTINESTIRESLS
jgi:hypothetical protein